MHAGTVWDPAICLLKYFEKNFTKLQEKFKQKNIIELGSGTGVIGLCLDEFEPEKVILTDMEQYLQPIHNNIQINKNKLQGKYEVQKLTWGKENKEQVKQILNILNNQIDIVIGSDLTYVSENTDKLFETLDIIYQLSENKQNFQFLMCYCLHKQGDDFFIEKYSNQWNFEQIKYRDYHKDFRSDDIKIVIIKKK
ncbi:hypothetical protein PPERSA_01961 [Pseudocohnilembus persalinus]|uniref:Uncharacterized protein n=1 Tax=Pseudocohnilembus persalinus TaxID=266149 RepID=A0A0V0R3K6_PSEPJ|nr:hypothetical protein PPERSA_01961 [Pseudocohnilembus persalinus]|eukprot:KRX09074.1 hypothetical protein PPERSA_01961 [Pseudocohnilembus persalinus]